MQQTLIEGQELQEHQEVMSLHEAAEHLGTSYKVFVNWLNRNPEIKEKYCTKRFYSGRRRTVIPKMALVVIATVKDSFRGNQHRKITAKQVFFRKGKVKLVEKAIEQPKSAILENLTRAVEELKNQVIILSQKIAPSTALALPVPQEEPPPISYRALINQRVRAYSKEYRVPYKDVWGRLYGEVYSRLHTNIYIKAERRKVKPIDVLAEEGLLHETWLICCKLFQLPNDPKDE